MHDVIIIGGAFSGASMGLLIKRARPEARVLIIERAAEFDRKVGESTSEVAACFLTRVLRISHHLNHEHLCKQGLRMWFTAPENQCPARCTEIGAFYQSRLPTFQIDRSLLDEHLLAMAQEEGCELWRPAKVEEIALASHGSSAHRLTVKLGGETREATAPWIVDASGKACVMARKLGLWRKLETHPTNSLWARFSGVKLLDSHESAMQFPDFADSVRCSRDMATNHLMGRGWWCWIIPLKNGDVSLGLTYDPRVFDAPKEGAIASRLLDHVKQHPIGRFLFADAQAVALDARGYSHLPYYADQVAGEGWTIVGDAAGFMDPLYSQGLDYCSHSVYTAHKLVVQSLAGEDVTASCAAFNSQFRQSYFRWYRSLYDGKYAYLGEADLMRAAFLMDLACYFIGPVRLVYERPDAEFGVMPYQGRAGAIFASFMSFYNRRLASIADKRAAAGAAARQNVGNRWLIKQGFVPTAKVLSLLARGLLIWFRAEFEAVFLTAVSSAAVRPVAASEQASQSGV
ncbi:MAG: NAD(P)/FAD-dependent oxidoreductase [Verrucomicrobiaceae bacterium]|nr:NAD(P)/FAD-dependent oxidoreductase [Verrucomicrobiaceae bacterium]